MKQLLAPQLETERLLLRWPQPDDAAVVQQAMAESWPSLTSWMYWTRAGLPDLENTRQRQEDAAQASANGTALHYDLFLRTTGEFVGKVSFFTIDWDVPRAGIAYWLWTRHEGKGYMTEAVTALTTYGMETLRLARIQIDLDPQNHRSDAIPQRCGYTLEGVVRNSGRGLDGALRDMAIYAKTAPRA